MVEQRKQDRPTPRCLALARERQSRSSTARVMRQTGTVAVESLSFAQHLRLEPKSSPFSSDDYPGIFISDYLRRTLDDRRLRKLYSGNPPGLVSESLGMGSFKRN